MSSIKKAGISRQKKSLFPSKSGYFGSKGIRFNHQASVGDTSIDLNNLNNGISGFVNPSVADLSNAGIYKDNLRLYSSLGYTLIPEQDYTVVGSVITFLNDLGSIGAKEGEIFFGELILPSSNAVISETRNENDSYTLAVGQTTLLLGKSFPVNENPSKQIGAIKVYREGKLQARCVGNVISGEGNYIEIDSGNGFGNQIQFKTTNESFEDGVLVEFGQSSLGNVNIISDVERLAGAVNQLANDTSLLTGNPVTDYLTATPSEVDRLTQASQVISNTSEISNVRNLVGTVLHNSGSASTIGTSNDNPVTSISLTPGYWLIDGSVAFNRDSGSSSTTFLRMRWNETTGSFVAPGTSPNIEVIRGSDGFDAWFENFNAPQDLSSSKGGAAPLYVKINSNDTIHMTANLNVSGVWNVVGCIFAKKIADL